MKKSRLVTIFGGTGFIGAKLIARMSTAQYRLRIVTRYREAHRALLVIPGLELCQGNALDPQVIDRLVADADVVINLVGILNEKGHRGHGFEQIHSEFTRNVVAACVRHRVGQMLQMSALNADALNGPSHYLRSKGMAEDAVRAAGAHLRFNIFQPSVIFGPADSFTNRFAALLKTVPLFFPLAMPEARMAPVYIDDVADAMMRCLEDRSLNGKTFELCGPDAYPLREIVAMIAEASGHQRVILGLGQSLSRWQAAVCEFLPGKPFSLDNFRSLSRDSVCRVDGFEQLAITPHRFRDLIPLWLAPR